MIISHQHRFIFFAIPKTGTHSVRQALRPHLGPQDLEQVGLFVQKRFPFKAFEGIRHGHISAQQILPVLGEDTFARYFKFAFARNPFDRFVSYCAFMGREDRAFESAPRDFMRYIVHERKPVNHLLYRPQHELVVDSTGRLAMDYVGRTEDMQGGYDEVCRRLGLAPASLGRVNTSRHSHWSQYYDKDLADAVRALYQRDFELFEYDDRIPA